MVVALLIYLLELSYTCSPQLGTTARHFRWPWVQPRRPSSMVRGPHPSKHSLPHTPFYTRTKYTHTMLRARKLTAVGADGAQSPRAAGAAPVLPREDWRELHAHPAREAAPVQYRFFCLLTGRRLYLPTGEASPLRVVVSHWRRSPMLQRVLQLLVVGGNIEIFKVSLYVALL